MGNIFRKARHQQIDNVGRTTTQQMDVEDQYSPLILQDRTGVVNQQVGDGVVNQPVVKHIFIRLWEAIVKFFRKLFTRVGPEPPQGGNPPENQQDVAKHIFVRLWEGIVKFFTKLFTRVAPEPPQDSSNPPAAAERNYNKGIIAVFPEYKIKINGPSDLKPIADLVKEKGELVKHLESIYKSGRDYRHNIIITFVGTMLVGILNAIVDGLLADHISLGGRIIVLGIFSVSFIVYLGGAIYEPSLTDAVSSHSTIIRSMNVHRDALMVKEDSDEAQIELQGLSKLAESELQLTLENYCKKIVHPLPIHRQKTASFIMIGSMVVALVFAGILKAALSLSGSSSPGPGPAPAPYFG